MSNYLYRVAGNILPLSNHEKLPDAFEEWYFTENVYDNEASEIECELCNQENLRYQFEIENRYTDKKLWIGSSCILRFEIQVFFEDQLLDIDETAKWLEFLKSEMRHESCLRALEKVSSSENNNILANALNFYRKCQWLTPKFAFVVFCRLQVNGIDHSPSFFKIRLNKDKYKQDLADMSHSKLKVIWKALSSSQKKLALSLGHSEPDF